MKNLLIYLALSIVQMNTLQDLSVVHLRPHMNLVAAEFGGHMLELINSPPSIKLPEIAPRIDSQGKPWSISIKNLGPSGPVTVLGKSNFSLTVNVGQTIRIASNGQAYSVVH
jgi:hypothetical protein